MKLSKIEQELMLESGCARETKSSYGGRVVENGDKGDSYYRLLDETSRLSQIRTSRWVDFWSVVAIVCIILGGVCCASHFVYNEMSKHYVPSSVVENR